MRQPRVGPAGGRAVSASDPHINAYLDRTLDAEAMAAFSRRIAADPALAKRYIEAIQFDVALRDQYRGALEVDGLLEVDDDDLFAVSDDGTGEGAASLKDLLALEVTSESIQPVDITDTLRDRQSRQKKWQRRQAALRARQREHFGAAGRPGRAVSWGLLAAVVTILVVLSAWLTMGGGDKTTPTTADNRTNPTAPGGSTEAADTGIVMSMRSTAEWVRVESLDTALPGVPLSAGTYHLKHGVAELVYPGGTVVTVLAPAEVQLTRRNGLTVRQGRVLCESPSGSGAFRIDTDRGRFTSMGARLGVEVEPQELSSYVFAGSADFQAGQTRVGLQRADRLVALGTGPMRVQSDAPLPNNLPQDFAGFTAYADRGIIVSETFDNAHALENFVVGQGYLVNGSTPGTATVRSGQLVLEPGGDNTVCCYMQPAGQVLPVGMRWVVDVAAIYNTTGDDRYTLFLAISSSPAQPGANSAENPLRNGACGFRLRWDATAQGVRIESDGGLPDWDTPYDLEHPLPPVRLAISRAGNSRFAFWVMFEGEDDWRLVGERTHRSLATDLPLSVGIEAYSWFRGRSFAFDNLRLESIPD